MTSGLVAVGIEVEVGTPVAHLHLSTLKYKFIHISPYILFFSKNTPYIVNKFQILGGAIAPLAPM